MPTCEPRKKRTRKSLGFGRWLRAGTQSLRLARSILAIAHGYRPRCQETRLFLVYARHILTRVDIQRIQLLARRDCHRLRLRRLTVLSLRP